MTDQADARGVQALSDDELLHRLSQIVNRSRAAEAELVAHIGEVDRRRLYARFAAPSMFAYCTERLHLSEAEAYRRITVARAAREHPRLLEMLADGRVHLSGLARLVPHLTAENCDSVLARAVHRSKRQIEELVAELSPQSDVPASIRKLPDRLPGRPRRSDAAGDPSVVTLCGLDTANEQHRPNELVPGRVAPSVVLMPCTKPTAPLERRAPALDAMKSSPVEPLAPGRYKVQFTASAELRDNLERLQALMRSTVPDGDLGVIIGAAVTEKLERLEARRFGGTPKPRAVRPAARDQPSAAEQHQPSAAEQRYLSAAEHHQPSAAAQRQRSPAQQRPPAGSQPGVAGDHPVARAASNASRPTPAPRYIPVAVRRAVRARDGDQCRYVDAQQRRCTARSGLEFHHRHPFGHGGRPTIDNISLLCRTHNAYLAEVDYGREPMRRSRRPQSLPLHLPTSP